MSKAFKSSDFFFRPTSLGQRLAEAGLVSSPHLVREPVLEIVTSGGKHKILRRGA